VHIKNQKLCEGLNILALKDSGGLLQLVAKDLLGCDKYSIVVLTRLWQPSVHILKFKNGVG
jgi:hypothetical protein